MVVYLFLGDWAISAFAAIIFFPVARVTATAIHARVACNANRRARRNDAEHTFSTLSDEERAVVAEFLNAGGCVITWSQANNSSISGAAIESLIQREILSASMTADGMRETFVLDPVFSRLALLAPKPLQPSNPSMERRFPASRKTPLISNVRHLQGASVVSLP